MHYIFRYLLGYRLGTIFSCYLIVVLYYQAKKVLQYISNTKKSKSLYAYGILTIFIVTWFVGSYQIDNIALIFLLELFYIIFCKDELLKNKKLLYFTTLLAGISIGIKVSNVFFVAILLLYGIIKNRKDLKALKIRDFFIGAFLIIIPFVIYLYDNYKQTGSILFPYYNSILKSEYFEITVLFYNPNIDTDEEYEKRAEELKRFIKEKEFKKHVDIIDMDHDPQVFYDAVKGYEHYEEGADRCFLCYRLRMEMAAKLAAKEQYDYFCTTLSISPLKNAEAINSIGYELADIYGVSWLPSDFKKNNGYLRSIELSKEYDLYRQNYCGCIFSKKKESPFSDCID